MQTRRLTKSFEPFNTLRAGVRYICTSISAEKAAVFGCLTNVLAPPPIALESCSSALTDRSVLVDCTRKKIFWLGGADFL